MIYLLYKTDFNSTEKNIIEALDKKIIGYSDDEAEAKFFMDFYSKGEKEYQGWDNKKYPVFTYEVIKQL